MVKKSNKYFVTIPVTAEIEVKFKSKETDKYDIIKDAVEVAKKKKIKILSTDWEVNNDILEESDLDELIQKL